MTVTTEKSAAPYVPRSHSLPALRKAAKSCHGCPLYREATQTVFGEGPPDARIVFVGEQPGDREDLAGHPFVGPSGKLLDEALEKAGIPRAETYVTNAVKHFKWVPRGTHRLHAKPGALEIRACHPWLEAEMEAVDPEIVICLGATAARAVFGRATPVIANRGKWLASPFSRHTLVTVHPSAILRQTDPEARREAFDAFVRDLKHARH